MSWTDERIELLAKLWGEGFSASQIAGQLGGITRNAVIGKVHRLKLETRAKVIAEPACVKAVAVAEPETVVEIETARVVQMQAGVRVMARGAGGVQGAVAFKMQEPETIDLPEEIEKEPERGPAEIVPISRNLTLVQLTERTCKWPLGDPMSADFRFCGNHSDDSSPYCQYHSRIAFQPAAERRRLR